MVFDSPIRGPFTAEETLLLDGDGNILCDIFGPDIARHDDEETAKWIAAAMSATWTVNPANPIAAAEGYGALLAVAKEAASFIGADPKSLLADKLRAAIAKVERKP